jgi:hypothetical protein
MRKFDHQTRTNDTIPNLSTAAKVSAVLDLISDDAGDILRRGASAWAGLSTPGGTTKFLRADGTYAVPPDTTYDLATTSTAGLAPALPGDATKYLDGTGAYSTPAGGSGGGGLGAWQPPTAGTASSSAYATKGGVFVPLIDCSMEYVWTSFAEVSGGSYKASLWTVSGQELATKIGETAVWSGDSAVGLNRVTKITTPWAMTAGTSYVLMVTRTDSDATYALPVGGTGAAFTTVPCDNTGPFFRIASTDPQPGDTNDTTLNFLMHGFAISSQG